MGKHRKSGHKFAKVNGEVFGDAKEEARIEERWHIIGDGHPPRRNGKKYRYIEELARLQFELIKLQEWVRMKGLRVVRALRRPGCGRQRRRHQAHH